MNNIDDQLISRFAKIKLLALDFDGVLTDGYVYVSQDGKEMVRCSRVDSLGIKLLKEHNIEVVVISKETNPIVSARCQKLDLECWQSVENSEGKLEIIKRLADRNKIVLGEIAYMGDDLNDFNVFGNVGMSIAVNNAHEKLKEKADYVTAKNGGENAVRDVCELILTAKNISLIY